MSIRCNLCWPVTRNQADYIVTFGVQDQKLNVCHYCLEDLTLLGFNANQIIRTYTKLAGGFYLRKTRVRIVGDPELAAKVLNIIDEHFEIDQVRHFKKAPTRYSRSNSPGHTIYIDVVRPKEASE